VVVDDTETSLYDGRDEDGSPSVAQVSALAILAVEGAGDVDERRHAGRLPATRQLSGMNGRMSTDQLRAVPLLSGISEAGFERIDPAVASAAGFDRAQDLRLHLLLAHQGSSSPRF